MSDPVVELRDVSVVYTDGPPWARRHTEALRGLNVEIQPGETLGLVGESGSGKTTAGHVAVGLLRPDEGEARFQGVSMARGVGRNGDIQAVLQQPDWSLNPRLKVVTSVAEPLTITREGSRSERHERALEMLSRVGLDPAFGSRHPHELSGGQRQRVAIARALVTDPRFILFDEVVTALDVSVQAQILNLLRELQSERGFGSIFISHDLAVVRYVADRIGVLFRGELVEDAPAERFYEQPEHPYSQRLRDAVDGIYHSPEPTGTAW